jgi:hypothetical protein
VVTKWLACPFFEEKNNNTCDGREVDEEWTSSDAKSGDEIQTLNLFLKSRAWPTIGVAKARR